MKNRCYLSLFIIFVVTATFTCADTIKVYSKLNNIKRIVFLGDSITQGGEYIVDFQCWLLAKHLNVEVLNLGLSSETATLLSASENKDHVSKYGFARPYIGERIDRVLKETKPDMVIACYGMNDGGSLPRNESGTKRFSDALTHLREVCRKYSVKDVILCTPPVHDAKGDTKALYHDENLTRYTDWLVQERIMNWHVVDIHTPMKKALFEGRLLNPGFAFAKDGVHPDRNGHWVMAQAILSQEFDAKLDHVKAAEDLFEKNGAQIRKLVHEKMTTQFNYWMSITKHLRPNVAGGPGVTSSATISSTNEKVATLNKSIVQLLLN
jgi:lysophospholipase L1-like esterase